MKIHTKRAWTIPFVLTLVVAFSQADTLLAQPRALVRSGHTDEITAMATLPGENLLFTAGEDGKLMVWDTRTEALLQSIRADRFPVRAIAPFPNGNEVALYSSDGNRLHRISLWNWKTGQRRYLHTPDGEVLWMEASPRGSYLLYSVPGLRSMRILRASSGRRLPFLQQATSIVSWFVTAGSEERVMTYSPSSGNIVYRNIANGRVEGEFEGPSDLSNLHLLSQRRFAAAETATGTLAVVDLLSGNVVDQAEAGRIRKIHHDALREEILVLSQTSGRMPEIRRFRFHQGRLEETSPAMRLPQHTINNIASLDRLLYGSDLEGRLFLLPHQGDDPTLFAESIIEPITTIATSNDRLWIFTQEELLSLPTQFLADMRRARPGQPISPVGATSFSVAMGKGARIVPGNHDGEKLLLWSPEDSRSPLKRIDGLTGEVTDLPIRLSSGVRSIYAHGNEILTLSRAGELAMVNLDSGNETFSYRGTGFQTAMRTDRDIFLGKAYTGGFLDSALLRIDPRTGQTVPMETDARLIFSLTYDPRRGRLFATGISNSQGGETATVIEVFDGPNYSRRRTILEIPGEYLDARITVDPLRGAVYTTLDDRGGVLRWDGSRVSELSRNQAHMPRRLVLNDHYVFSVNWDGTLSLISRFSEESVLDITVVRTASGAAWIAQRPDGLFHTSHPALADPYIISVNDSRTTLEDLIVREEEPEKELPEDEEKEEDEASRFESGRFHDSLIDEETDYFDPESGDPAPSS
ncbi:WD40 repeat [Alkalispirochaeta americana]|uniref:WD40 repeat n=1 Tax=Alkalispirochaeta americana TaxID=159291 RepID=A0A1N6PSJ9_9SPIO|nr:PQQ-binding-like beta-propeller repeat protein [Alkalispirochaeta americana]SIQ07330.1 WD40 repeat [Alkalispirochaeta americana]